MNNSPATATTMMPSPQQASEPRNRAEAEIKRLIDQALQSGAPTEYADAGSFIQELRNDMRQRQSQTR